MSIFSSSTFNMTVEENTFHLVISSHILTAILLIVLAIQVIRLYRDLRSDGKKAQEQDGSDIQQKN